MKNAKDVVEQVETRYAVAVSFSFDSVHESEDLSPEEDAAWIRDEEKEIRSRVKDIIDDFKYGDAKPEIGVAVSIKKKRPTGLSYVRGAGFGIPKDKVADAIALAKQIRALEKKLRALKGSHASKT